MNSEPRSLASPSPASVFPRGRGAHDASTPLRHALRRPPVPACRPPIRSRSAPPRGDRPGPSSPAEGLGPGARPGWCANVTGRSAPRSGPRPAHSSVLPTRPSAFRPDALLTAARVVQALLHDGLGHVIIELPSGARTRQYWNVYTLSNLARSTTPSVPESSSVSPGNPTMMSVHGDGRGSRLGCVRATRGTNPAYTSDACSQHGVDPDWSGKWMCSHTAGVSTIA